MSDEELGLGNCIELDGNDTSIAVTEDSMGKEMKSCWSSNLWSYSERLSLGEQLASAQKTGSRSSNCHGCPSYGNLRQIIYDGPRSRCRRCGQATRSPSHH